VNWLQLKQNVKHALWNFYYYVFKTGQRKLYQLCFLSHNFCPFNTINTLKALLLTCKDWD